MTNNHLLLYRLTDLMLEKQQHILALDDLFEDEQIGAFVRSIQIDSPYQQLIFEGILTETIKEERVMVTFTVEGYFHYVLGEVIEKQTDDKGAEALKELLENNQLRGITEGIEQCLVRDVEKNDLSRLMWLIDEGGKALEASAYPLAQAFSIIEGNPKTDEEKEEASKKQIERVMDELLADPTDNDIKVLKKAIDKLESAQLNSKIKTLYQVFNNRIEPNSILIASLCVESIKYIPKERRKKEIDKLKSFTVNEENEIAGDFYFAIGSQFNFIADYDKAIQYYEKSLVIILKVHGDQHPSTSTSYNNLGFVWDDKGEYDKAIQYYEKSLAIRLKVHGDQHPSTGTSYNNLGLVWMKKGKYDKAIEYYEKSLAINLKVHRNQHPSTGRSYNNLGSAWNKKGVYDKAIQYYEKSLAIKLKVHGDKHPSNGTSFFVSADVYFKMKMFKKALNYFNKGFLCNQESGGFPFKIAICYENLNQLEEATKNYCLSAEIRKKALGIKHDGTQKAIQEAIRLAKDINNLELLPNWIIKIANDQ